MKLSTIKFTLAFLIVASSVHAQNNIHSAWDRGNDSLKYIKVDSTADRNHFIDRNSQTTRYDKRVHYYRKNWGELIPTQGIVQVCGNMGVFSIGLGWDYGKRRQWETNLLVGWIPRFDSSNSKLTFTLKENYIPWSRYLDKGWSFEPLECSLYLNTVFGHDFWTKQPTKYENGYYPFSTRIRPNLAVGQRFTKLIPDSRRKRIKSFTMFYELGTNDIYFMRFYRNGSAGFWDVFGLSFGVKAQFL